MQLTSALRWSLYDRALALLPFLLGLLIAAAGVWLGASAFLDELLFGDPSDLGTPSNPALIAAGVVLGFVVWQVGRATVRYKAMSAALENRIDELVDEERIASTAASKVDDRIADVENDVQQLERKTTRVEQQARGDELGSAELEPDEFGDDAPPTSAGGADPADAAAASSASAAGTDDAGSGAAGTDADADDAGASDAAAATDTAPTTDAAADEPDAGATNAGAADASTDSDGAAADEAGESTDEEDASDGGEGSDSGGTADDGDEGDGSESDANASDGSGADGDDGFEWEDDDDDGEYYRNS